MVPVWGGGGRGGDPGLLLSHGHDGLLLLGQTLHLCLQGAQRRVQPLDGACVLCDVDLSRTHAWERAGKNKA